MGFLDRLRLSQAENEHWIGITDMNQLDIIDQQSKEKTVVIFKHSTSCGISAGAKYRLEANWDHLSGDVLFYYLDILSYRAISNEIASRYRVRHESPQILIIKDGVASYDTSHHRISVDALNNALD